MLEAARPLRQIGLKELVAECAALEGHPIPRVFGDGRATINAGFATISLPGILESVMNRTLLATGLARMMAQRDDKDRDLDIPLPRRVCLTLVSGPVVWPGPGRAAP